MAETAAIDELSECRENNGILGGLEQVAAASQQSVVLVL